MLKNGLSEAQIVAQNNVTRIYGCANYAYNLDVTNKQQKLEVWLEKNGKKENTIH